jgi:hypothetical protein
MKSHPPTECAPARPSLVGPLRFLLPVALASALASQARAVNVDSEIVLLVDVTRPGLSDTQFSQLMDGYASAFTSTNVIDSIQSGYYGRVAVSMMFYGNTNTQIAGIQWMEIGSLSQAQQFAAIARSLTMPFVTGSADVGAALTAATLTFGTETGGTANGFESVVQMVEVATARRQPNQTAATAAAGSDFAMNSGVDLINSLALGNQATQIDAFYEANVIGSTIPGVSPTGTTSPINGTLATTINSLFAETTQNGATASMNAIPEPNVLFGLVPAVFILFRRRRI